LHALAARLERQGRRAVVDRARTLARVSRAPADHVARHRTRLHQLARELRAGTHRGLADRGRAVHAQAGALDRRARAAVHGAGRGAQRTRADAVALERARRSASARRAADLERLALALAAHEPQRTLERGYALVEAPDGEPLTSAGAARRHARLVLRLADGALGVRPERGGGAGHDPPTVGGQNHAAVTAAGSDAPAASGHYPPAVGGHHAAVRPAGSDAPAASRHDPPAVGGRDAPAAGERTPKRAAAGGDERAFDGATLQDGLW
jgi:exodeoxyribonuclease VII large subunit